MILAARTAEMPTHVSAVTSHSQQTTSFSKLTRLVKQESADHSAARYSTENPRLLLARIILLAEKGRTAREICTVLRQDDVCQTPTSVAAMISGWKSTRGELDTLGGRLDLALKSRIDLPPDDDQNSIFVTCFHPSLGSTIKFILVDYLSPMSLEPEDRNDTRSWFSRREPKNDLLVRLPDDHFLSVDLDTQEAIGLLPSQAQQWFCDHGRTNDLPAVLRRVVMEPVKGMEPETLAAANDGEEKDSPGASDTGGTEADDARSQRYDDR